MFRRQELVRFQHCDPAGIVFYPRYVEMINATVEDWFAEVVGISFADIHGKMNSAVPVASLSIDFHSPSRLGEVLHLDLDVSRLGNSSTTLLVTASQGDTLRFESKLTLVHISMEDYKSRPWPDDMRNAISAFAPSLTHSSGMAS